MLVWVYGRKRDRIPAAAQQRMDTAQRLFISPMVELELAYLFEVGRVGGPPDKVLRDLASTLELTVSTAPFPVVVRHALSLTWTRDPFDRVIAAQAIADDATLLTADRTLLANLPRASWD